MKIRSKLLSICIALLLSVMLGSNTVSAASKCKGLSQSACETGNMCGWIAKFKRKDGAKVKAYCRSKPKKSSLINSAKKTEKPKIKGQPKAASTKKVSKKEAAKNVISKAEEKILLEKKTN